MRDDVVYIKHDNEEWDEGEDKKWILTFRVLDNYEIKPELN